MSLFLILAQKWRKDRLPLEMSPGCRGFDHTTRLKKDWTVSREKKSQAVFILGVHGSETSVLARIVNLLGVYLGVGLLLPTPDQDSDGSWEHGEIVRLHDDILDLLGSNGLDPSPLPAGWWESREFEKQRQRLIDILEGEFLDKSIWCVEDTRLCRLFPLWRAVLSELSCEPFCLVVVQNPEAVAQSLAEQDYLPREISRLIWLDHLIQAEEHTRGLPRAIVHVEDLVADWKASVARATETVGIEWPKLFDEIEDEVRQFLRNRRAAETTLYGSEDVPTWIHDVYSSLSGVSASNEIRHWERDVAELGNEFRKMAELYEKFTRQRSWQMDALLQELHRTRAELSRATTRHSKQIRQMEAEIRAGNQAQGEREEKYRATVSELKRRYRKEIRKLKKRRRAEIGRRDELNDATLKKQAECYEASMAHLQEKIAASESVLFQVLGSRSWRLTAPLRRAKLRLAGLRAWLSGRLMREPESTGTRMAEGAVDSAARREKTVATSNAILSTKESKSRLMAGDVEEASRCVLVVDHQFPKPDQDSGSVRAHSILEILRKLGFDIRFYSDAFEYPSRYTRDLEARGVRCVYASQDGPLDRYLASCGINFDAVILSRAPTAEKYLGVVRERLPGAKVVFDTVDLYYLREAREAELLNGTVDLWAVRRRKVTELAAARFSDVTWVVSEKEREILWREDPEIRAEIVSNIVPPKPTKASFSARADIVFLGSFAHKPNIDAATYYVRDIHPLVRQALPRARLFVVGSDPPHEVRALANESIVVSGYVPDLKPYYNRFRVSIAPLRYGAGVKGKINTSLSFGVPLVTTPLGAEGMKLVHEKHALFASDPRDFAASIHRLYTDEVLWTSLRKAGLEHLRSHYSFDRAEQTIKACLGGGSDDN
jgi:glycosyltransferase involved in cell wall biosynthesis